MPEITGWHRITCDNEPANPKCIIITREVFEGIPKPMVVSFYFAVAAALSCSFWLFSIRTKNYGRGKDEDRSTTKQNFKLRVAKLYQSLSMKTLMRDRSAGLMHSCLYFGFLGLLLATITLEIDHQLPTSFKFLEGTTYQVYSFLSDLAGVVFLIGCIWAFYRRYIQKVDRLKSKTEREDGFNLALLFSLGVTGFFVEAFRISIFMNQHRPIDFERYSFIGFPLARFLDDLMTANHLAIFHRWTWTIHIGLFLIFLIVLPATKLRHMVTSPINSYLSPSEKPKGSLTPMEDLTTSEQNSFGAGTVEDFTWKQLYDTDACTTCGRCTSVCPANATGKVLDPRRIVLSINEVMTSSGEVVVSPTVTTKQSVNNIKVGTNEITSLVSREEVFACTTCKACDEICPVNIEIMDKIVDIRRYYTLMESSFPSELSNAYRGMENQENPWSISQSERANWTKEVDIEVPIIDPQNKNSFVNEKGNFKFDVLYWVGCAGSFDDRAKKTTKALASLLNRAGISFAILGSNEKCTGDPARRSGNEYIFQMLAMENINNLNEINPTTILTQCPHCFNTLKNEYKDFGGNFNVQHHTQFLLKLIDEEKIKIEDATLNEKITLHDSCYLTRHNDVIEEPRKIIGSIKGIEVIEMNRNKKSNFCCGAGGAQFFMEELGDERVNINRAKEAINTGANTIITECPFCSVMLGDGVASIEQDGKHTAVKDLAVLLDESFNDQLNQI
ncbi:MAG: heterodisulfide reductase-related iron-sulfur binding cluster [Acidimicrobiia bacterium]